MSVRVTLNKWGYNLYVKYYGKPEKDSHSFFTNIWGKDSDDYYDEDNIIAELKSEICRLIDEQRTVIIDELQKAGVYEPADV